MTRKWLAAALVIAISAITGLAQEKTSAAKQEKPTSAPEPAGAVALRVSVVISRYQGEKKIGSLPYVFGVTTNDRTNLRMGSDVPIVSRAPKTGDAPFPNVSYRSVGTNIDCIAFPPGPGGVFKLTLTIEDSSVHLDPGQKPGAPGGSFIPGMVNDFPSFRTFRTNFGALLRDGQTMQHTSATDPVSGEVMRVDVTLNVMK